MQRDLPPARLRAKSKRKEAAMASVEELAAVLGVGLNQAYVALQMGQIPALRFGRRWLISRKTIDRITNGELSATTAA